MQDNSAVKTIAVIIPVLNEADTIRNFLQSLLQKHRFDEVIVVDGGSTDNTVEIINNLPTGLKQAITALHSSAGRARQMNRGAQQAKSDILLFLHADTVLPDQAAACIRDALAGDNYWGRFDIRIDGQAILFRVIERMMNWRSALSGIATGDQCIFIRRDLFAQQGGFADIVLMEDIELSRRLKRAGRPARIRQAVLTSARRWQQNGVTRTILLMWWLRFLYWLGVSPQRLVKRYYPQTRVQPELILFAKQPLPGEVKTRLQPQYTAEQSAEIAAYLISKTVERVTRNWQGPVSLYVTPDTSHPLFTALSKRYALKLYIQQGGDLGDRMHRALAEGIGRNGAAAVMGCDVPQCSAETLRRACDGLVAGHVVLGPTRDGGYYLVGMTTPRQDLFDNIEWGSDRVLAETLARVRKINLDFMLLPDLIDIDSAADLQAVAREDTELQQFLQQGSTATAAATGGATETVSADRD